VNLFHNDPHQNCKQSTILSTVLFWVLYFQNDEVTTIAPDESGCYKILSLWPHRPKHRISHNLRLPSLLSNEQTVPCMTCNGPKDQDFCET